MAGADDSLRRKGITWTVGSDGKFKVHGWPASLGFQSVEEISAFMEAVDYRKIEAFNMGQKVWRNRDSGWYDYTFLRGILPQLEAKFPGATLYRESMGVSPESIDAIEETLKHIPGLPVVDEKLMRIMRINTGSKFLSDQEIYDFMTKDVGISFFDGLNAKMADKMQKRLTPLMSLRGYGIYDEAAAPMRIGVFNPSDLPNMWSLAAQGGGEDLAGMAYEGAVLGSKDFFARFQAQLLTKAADIRADPIVGLQTEDAIAARRLASRYEQQAEDLGRMISRGKGRFNVRLMGLGLEPSIMGMNNLGTDDSILEAVLRNNGITDQGQINKILGDPRSRANVIESLQLKGDVILAGDQFFEPGQDIATAVGNLKLGVGLRKGIFATIEEHKHGNRVFVDIQSLSSMPKFFDLDRLVSTSEGDITQMLSDLRMGNMPEGFRQALQDIIDQDVVDPDMADFKNYARRAIDHLALGGRLNEDPELVNGMVNSYAKFMDKTKTRTINGIKTRVSQPNFRIPDAFRAGITQTHLSGAGSPFGGSVVEKGFIDYINGSWVMQASDVPEYYQAFGGFDLDDTLVGLLRRDKVSGQMKVLAYRQPNALGEYGIFNVNPESSVVRTTIGQSGDQALIDDYNAVYQDLRDALKAGDQAEVTRLRGVLQGIVSNAPLEEVDLTGMQHITGWAEPDAAGIMAGADRRLRFATAQKNTAATVTQWSQQSALEKAEKFALSQGELGRYSNARMFLDSVLNQHTGTTGIKELDDFVFNVVTQETAIDASINAGELRIGAGTQKLSDLTRGIYEDAARYTAIARRHGINIGIDPWMMEHRASRSAVEAGLKREGATLDQVLLPEGTGPIGEIVSAYEAQKESFTRRAATELDSIKYESTLLDDPTARFYRADAQKIIQTYHNAIKENTAAGEVVDATRLVIGEGKVDWSAVHNETLKSILPYFEKDGSMGDALFNRLTALAQIVTERGKGFEILGQYASDEGSSPHTMADIFNYMRYKKRLAAGFDPASTIADLLTRADDAENLLGDEDRADDLRRQANAMEDARVRMEEFADLTKADFARQTADADLKFAAKVANPPAASKVLVSNTPFDRFTMAGMKEALNSPYGRKAGLAVAGLAAWGLVRMARKDHRPEDVQGPAHLPGGNPYAGQQRGGYGFASSNSSPSEEGITYRVRGAGDFNADSFVVDALAMTGGALMGAQVGSATRPRSSAPSEDQFLKEYR